MKIKPNERLKVWTSTLLIFSTMSVIKAYPQEKLGAEKKDNLKDNWVIGLRYGYNELFRFARQSNNQSSIEIADYHKQYQLKLEYYPFEKVSTHLSIGLLMMPKEKGIDSIYRVPGEGIHGINVRGTGKGGAILPVTVGIKKLFSNRRIHPYFSLATGIAFMKIGSGKASGGVDGIDKEIDIRSELKFCYETGVGVQMQAGKFLLFDFSLNGFGTPEISPAIGGMRSYSGWNFLGGVNFILNHRK